jgi:hypothetical protein
VGDEPGGRLIEEDHKHVWSPDFAFDGPIPEHQAFDAGNGVPVLRVEG